MKPAARAVNSPMLMWSAALVAGATAAACWPAFRYALFYNLLPLTAIGAAVIAVKRHWLRRSVFPLLACITATCAVFHVYSIAAFGVSMAFDSREYLQLAGLIADGHGLGGATYRPPLYPTIVSLGVLAGDRSGMAVVVLQHLLLIAAVPLVFRTARSLGFGEDAALIASALFAADSLVIQSSVYVMTEVVFLVLALLCIMALRRLFERPTLRQAAVTGLLFAVSAYCREMMLPVLMVGAGLLAVSRRRVGVIAALSVLAVYAAAVAPWSARNALLGGGFSMSSSLGVQLFTKAVTFHCLDTNGARYAAIERPLHNALDAMGARGYAPPLVPEDDWSVNRIPHVLMDTLVAHHGYSYSAASRLLGKAAIEGFVAHPCGYFAAWLNSFGTLLFAHREIRPGLQHLLPVEPAAMPTILRRLTTGTTYVSGIVLLLFPFAAWVRQPRPLWVWTPFALVLLMYGLTAAVQIGFTRYAVPWEPFRVICAAFVVDTVVRAIKRSTILVRASPASARAPGHGANPHHVQGP